MRFKIFFNEKSQSLDINCLTDSFTDTILPEDPSQHVYFPIPNEMKDQVKTYLMPIISEEIDAEYQAITDEIQALTDKRREMVNKLRAKLNPQIIDKCQEFKEENAEYFI